MKRRYSLIAFLVILPSIILVGIFVYGFIFNTFYVSLSDWGEAQALSINPKLSFVGLANYTKLFTGLIFHRFRQDFFNTVYYSAGLVFFALLLGLLIALVLDRNIAGEGTWRNLFLYPMALSFIVTGTVWRWIFAPSGGINVLPTLFNRPPLALDWLSSRDATLLVDWFALPRLVLCVLCLIFLVWGAVRLGKKRFLSAGIFFGVALLALIAGISYAPDSVVFERFFRTVAPEWRGFNFATVGIIIAAVWQYSGYTMALYSAGLKGIESSIRDAANIDGVSALRFYFHIALPMLRPITLSAVVVIAHVSLKLFALIFAMAGPDNAPTSHLSIMMFLQTFRANQFAQGAAIAVILFLLAMLFIIPYLVYMYANRQDVA